MSRAAAMNQAAMKQAAAKAALDYIRPRLAREGIIGVGTGSTVNYFIDALAEAKAEVRGAVASSEATAARLAAHGIPVCELNSVAALGVYVDGADESNRQLQLIKGGGGALAREKILAQAAAEFVCIIDEGKLVDELGAFPLPVEVLPMARRFVAGELAKLGGEPAAREGVVTDNGNAILDIRKFPIPDPPAAEAAINQIPGVVANGIFARRSADVLLLARADGSVDCLYKDEGRRHA